MNCYNIEKKLIFYSYGDLSAKENIEIDKHFNECLSCKNLYMDIQSSLNLIDSDKIAEPIESFTISVMSRIENYESILIKKSKKVLNIFNHVAIAASIILVIGLGILAGNFSVKNSNTQTSVNKNEIFYINDFAQEKVEFFLLNE